MFLLEGVPIVTPGVMTDAVSARPNQHLRHLRRPRARRSVRCNRVPRWGLTPWHIIVQFNTSTQYTYTLFIRPYYHMLCYAMLCYATVRHDMTWHDMTWRDVTWHDVTWEAIYNNAYIYIYIYNTIHMNHIINKQERYIWPGLTWRDVTWYDMIWYDMIWSNVPRRGPTPSSSIILFYIISPTLYYIVVC